MRKPNEVWLIFGKVVKENTAHINSFQRGDFSTAAAVFTLSTVVDYAWEGLNNEILGLCILC